MGIADNKKVAASFISALSEGRRDMTLLTDDARWWVPGRGVLDRDTFLSLANAFRAELDGPFRLTVSAITAEEDRVAVEASGHGRLKNGRTYANDYHFLFHLRDGLICEVREHNNSLVPHLLFGDKLPPMPILPEAAAMPA